MMATGRETEAGNEFSWEMRSSEILSLRSPCCPSARGVPESAPGAR